MAGPAQRTGLPDKIFRTRAFTIGCINTAAEQTAQISGVFTVPFAGKIRSMHVAADITTTNTNKVVLYDETAGADVIAIDDGTLLGASDVKNVDFTTIESDYADTAVAAGTCLSVRTTTGVGDTLEAMNVIIIIEPTDQRED